jgi:asparagine synthase (glutamine-hydrolysing)
MCGIAGRIHFRGIVDADLLVRQRDTMAHRGPDSSGIWCSDDLRVGFAHRRLAIIDLSPGGHQPMVDPFTGAVLTFNGEIYNYVELRRRLEGLGQQFRTRTDTEVILAAYRQWGCECVEALAGMFAFALYDPARQRVLLARDRAGEKPLFYRVPSDGFAFASEAKALLLDPSCSRGVRAQSVNEYFAYGYVSGENTMFADLKRVMPGGRVIIDLQQHSIRHDRYWQLPTTRDEARFKDAESLTDELHRLLKAAVRRQLMADVPIGILLSGGVDSSLITAIAAEVSLSRIRTFTVRFPGSPAFDEGPYARLVADHVGTEHVELEAKPADADLLRRLVKQFDEPIADSSMIPTFLVSEEIRQHATVALGGDGGDELFGGYLRYPALLQQQRMRDHVPRILRTVTSRSANRWLPEGVPGRGFLNSLAGDMGTGIANAGRIFREDERPSLSALLSDLSTEDRARPERIRSHATDSHGSCIQRATTLDFGTYMVDDILAKVDRASMLASLEVRAPFLDVHVTEFAFSHVPDALRATSKDRKVLLRRLGERLLPPSLDLRRKQGFSIPADKWMRGPWKTMLDEAAERRGPSIVSSAAIRRYRDLLVNRRPVGDRLYALLFLRLWEEHYEVTDMG